MHVARSIGFVPVFALAISGYASGQQIAPAAGSVVPEQRGYVSVLAGAVSGPPTEPVLSVEYGEDIHRNVQAYATLSYFENLMRQTLRDDLTALGTALSTVTGDPWQLRGRDRGVAFAAGAKYVVGSQRVRPYIGAGAGVINVKRTVIEAHLGDVTAAVFNDFDVGISDLSLASTSITRPLAEAAVGVGIDAGSTYVEVGYRYRRAFRLTDRLEFSQLSVGVGYRF
jgi:opacity protein-like surface antigen